MTYSYSQLAHYLSCPRRYRHRYLDGWQEKDTRAATVFGRCFEHALGAYFRQEDSTLAFFQEWPGYRDASLEFSRGETVEWIVENKALLALRRLDPPPSALKKTPPGSSPTSSNSGTSAASPSTSAVSPTVRKPSR